MRKFDKKMQALQWPAHFFCYVTVKQPFLKAQNTSGKESVPQFPAAA
jgi:hypothetical protein